MEVKIYTTSTCPYCTMAKKYLSAKGITYQQFDVLSDTLAQEELVKISGQMGVPVIVINGEVVVGFDKARIDALLSA